MRIVCNDGDTAAQAQVILQDLGLLEDRDYRAERPGTDTTAGVTYIVLVDTVPEALLPSLGALEGATVTKD